MPGVVLRFTGTDGKEETLNEYRCDWPDGCSEPAEHVIGVVIELRAYCAFCTEHKLQWDQKIAARKHTS